MISSNLKIVYFVSFFFSLPSLFQLLSKPPPTETQSVMGSVVSLKSNVDGVKDDETVDVKALQDRLKQSETRATDFRNQCQSLRQELKIAHKVSWIKERW